MAEDVGVVVVHYYREVELDRLLGELVGTHEIAPDRVIVVNNGGDASRLAEIRRRRFVRWIDLDNPGYGAAVNAGVRELEGIEFILVLTHEVMLEPTAITCLATALSSDSRIGVVGPLLRDSRTGLVWSAGGVTSRIRRLPRHRAAGAESVPGGNLDSEWLDGSCFMVRQRDLSEWAALDERFFLYFEDVDLGLRILRQGRRVVAVCESTAWQSPSGHLDQFYATRNLLWLFRKHRMRGPFGLYVFETLGRLAFGWIAKPAGAGERRSKRWSGLREGMARLS